MKCRFSLSYREIEEIGSIRGLDADHATLQRWVCRFISLLEAKFRKRKKALGEVGVWMKLISGSTEGGSIYIEPWINMDIL